MYMSDPSRHTGTSNLCASSGSPNIRRLSRLCGTWKPNQLAGFLGDVGGTGTPAWHEVKAHLPELATRTCDVGTLIGLISAVQCAAQGGNEVKKMDLYFFRACTEHEAGEKLDRQYLHRRGRIISAALQGR